MSHLCCTATEVLLLLRHQKQTTRDKIMSRYETQTWKDLEAVQNELSAYVDVDILTITGFMETDAELKAHLTANQRTLEKYKEGV